MAASRYTWLEIKDFTGGRNAVDDPCSLRENQVVEMRNGDTYRTHLFRKRGGATAPNIGSAFSGIISSLLAHYPNNNPAAAEQWGVDDAATPVVGRMAGATTFSAVTLKDAFSASTDAYKMRGASYAGKLVLAYKSAVDRLHVYDPNLGAPSARRTGQATSAAPTAADGGGGGSLAATKRYYRQRTRIKNGAIIVAQSEPSPSVTFTPDGSHLNATVTKAASISESETHWVVEGSLDNAVFFELSEIVIGTTTYADTADPNTYSTLALSLTTGQCTNWTSVKYVIAAWNRLIGMGSYASGGLQSRIWYSAAKGNADKGDDERVPYTNTVRNFFDIDEGTGGDGTGFAGPIYDSVYAFKYTQIRKFTPTGASNPVFDVITISTTRGAVDQECIAVGNDEAGRPTIYFLDSQLGPMSVGPTPPKEIGYAVRDQWDVVNLAATIKVGQVIDYPAKGQVWFWWATGSANEPNVLAIYTKNTESWQVFDTGGKMRLARAAVMFARVLGAAMSRDLVPYVSYQSTNNKLLRGDTTDTADDSTTFQATVRTRPFIANRGQIFRSTTPYLLAKVAAGVSLTVTAILDFGRVTQTTTIDLTATADEASATRVYRRCLGIDISGATFVQFEIGDAAAISNAWTIERLYVPVEQEDSNP